MRMLMKAALAGATALAMLAGRPEAGLAQLQGCGFCDSGGLPVTCDTSNPPTPYLMCEGVVFWLLCVECGSEENRPEAIAPDGTLALATGLGAAGSKSPRGLPAEELKDGVFVTRDRCTGGLTHLWYRQEVEATIRNRVAIISI